MDMDQDKALRKQLTQLLRGGEAFRPVEEVLQGITAAEAGQTVQQLPYTIWQLMEHLRFALYDILEFSRNPAYTAPAWPDDYWVSETAPADQAKLEASLQAIQEGIEQMVQRVQDTTQDLFTPFAHGDGQNLLREAMLIAEHNAYHLGEIVVLRRLLGNWE
ncbi:DinB family protein [Pontibacter roseus]|uniref:DinB family protein n=1 Tax=Pontibacter roseus TaxID=336989 RepID=UPI000374C9D5|nr:DinB family protein [Pontibacter roseus]